MVIDNRLKNSFRSYSVRLLKEKKEALPYAGDYVKGLKI